MLKDDNLHHNDLHEAMLNLHLACFCFDFSNHIKFVGYETISFHNCGSYGLPFLRSKGLTSDHRR